MGVCAGRRLRLWLPLWCTLVFAAVERFADWLLRELDLELQFGKSSCFSVSQLARWARADLVHSFTATLNTRQFRPNWDV